MAATPSGHWKRKLETLGFSSSSQSALLRLIGHGWRHVSSSVIHAHSRTGDVPSTTPQGVSHAKPNAINTEVNRILVLEISRSDESTNYRAKASDQSLTINWSAFHSIFSRQWRYFFIVVNVKGFEARWNGRPSTIWEIRLFHHSPSPSGSSNHWYSISDSMTSWQFL